MKCVFCGEKTIVIDSRESVRREGEFRRRRKCPVCKGRFTTYEAWEGAEFASLKIGDMTIGELFRKLGET